jgi:hypothetical protein
LASSVAEAVSEEQSKIESDGERENIAQQFAKELLMVCDPN